MGILIFGRPNSGRKTLASLLPTAIEQCAYGDYGEPGGTITIRCRSGSAGQPQIREIKEQLQRTCLETVSRCRYVTLIDIEDLSADAQQDLKSLMNTPHVVFVLIASRIARLDNGVLDRCSHKIYMEFPKSYLLETLARSVLIPLEPLTLSSVVCEVLAIEPRSYSALFIELQRRKRDIVIS
jgi:hypothetical protein